MIHLSRLIVQILGMLVCRKGGKVVIEIIWIGVCREVVSLIALVERKRGVAIFLSH